MDCSRQEWSQALYWQLRTQCCVCAASDVLSFKICGGRSCDKVEGTKGRWCISDRSGTESGRRETEWDLTSGWKDCQLKAGKKGLKNCLGQEAGHKGSVGTCWFKLWSKFRTEKLCGFGREKWEKNQWSEIGNEGWQERSVEVWAFWGEPNCWTKIQRDTKKWKKNWGLGVVVSFWKEV